MNGISFQQIHGLREAIDKATAEQESKRERAWKNLTYDFFGFRVRTMTVLDYTLLDHFRSPFLYRTIPQLCDLDFFLWRLSPECQKWDARKLDWFSRISAFFFSRKIKRIFNQERFEQVIKLAFDYVDDMFLDAPPSGSKHGISQCYLASWFDLLQSEHHMTDEQIWLMPLPQLFQRIRAIQIRKGINVPKPNRMEEEVTHWIASGIASGRFTYDDLRSGRVKFGEN